MIFWRALIPRRVRDLKTRPTHRSRGSFLLESLVVILPVFLAFGWVLDSFRMARWGLILQHSCFMYARSRRLGLGPERAKDELQPFWDKALGGQAQPILNRLVIREFQRTVHLRMRYKPFFQFKIPNRINGSIHHKKGFEVTRLCSLPF